MKESPLEAFSNAMTSQETRRILRSMNRRTTKRVSAELRTDASSLPGLTLSQSLRAVDDHLTALAQPAEEEDLTLGGGEILLPLAVFCSGLALPCLVYLACIAIGGIDFFLGT